MAKGNGCLLWMLGGGLALFVLGQCLGPIASSHPVDRNSKSYKASVELLDLRCAAFYYWKAHGRLPSFANNALFAKDIVADFKSGLLDRPWVQSADGEFVDPWGTTLRISSPHERSLLIESAGPDKIWGTADDLRDGSHFTRNGYITGIVDSDL